MRLVLFQFGKKVSICGAMRPVWEHFGSDFVLDIKCFANDFEMLFEIVFDCIFRKIGLSKIMCVCVFDNIC